MKALHCTFNCQQRTLITVSLSALLNYPTFLSQLLLLVRVWTASWRFSAVIWHLGRLGPFLLSAHLCLASRLPVSASRRWRCSSFGLLFSLKDLGGWRHLWWKGLRGILPVPVQKASTEYIIMIQSARSTLYDSGIPVEDHQVPYKQNLYSIMSSFYSVWW